MQTIVTGHAAGPPDPQLELHADTFHPSLKAWLFLTDVTDDQGPLTYVAGSHRLTPERLAWEQARSIDIERQRPSVAARLAPDHARGASGARPPSADALRGSRQHPGRDRHLRLPCPRQLRPADHARRNLGFRPPHAVRAVDRASTCSRGSRSRFGALPGSTGSTTGSTAPASRSSTGSRPDNAARSTFEPPQAARLRHVAGGAPYSRLNARLNAASLWKPTA